MLMRFLLLSSVIQSPESFISQSRGITGTTLSRLFDRVINTTTIEKEYRDTTREVQLNETEFMEHVSGLVSREFNEAFRAINRLRDAGRDAYQSYTWTPDGENNYWNSFSHPLQSTNGSYLDLMYDERYDEFISYDDSVVNLPIDVFENWTEVMNTIQWSKGMNKAFINNHRQGPDNIYWQYIGTPQGVMRFYPGSEVPEKGRVDLDVRRRPWYTEGTGCPKDVVLLIDTSGSLDGFPATLLKSTVRSFIELILSDSDFVNALEVSETVKFLLCDMFLQRSESWVKQLLIEKISGIRPNGTSNWQEAFQMAFEIFRVSKEMGFTANCRKVVVIFSDETKEDILGMIKKLDPQGEVKFNVFSFVRGKSLSHDRFNNLACTTNGLYLKVLYFGQIENSIQRIVKMDNVEMRDAEVQPTWSNAYIDMAGFGLVITLTLPIVTPTSPSQSQIIQDNDNANISFIGIVGLDFKTSSVAEKLIGDLPLTLSVILVNNKGYPIHHGRMDKYKNKDVTTKLQDFRFTWRNREVLQEIENSMMTKQRKVFHTKGFLDLEGSHRGIDHEQDLTYQVSAISNTPFAVSLVYTDYPLRVRVLKQATIKMSDVWEFLRRTYPIAVPFGKENNCARKPFKQVLQIKGDADICGYLNLSRLTDIMVSRGFIRGVLNPKDLKISKNFMITYSGLVVNSRNGFNTLKHTKLTSASAFYDAIKNQSQMHVSRPKPHPKLGYQVVNVTKTILVDGMVVAAVGFEIELENLKDSIFEGMSMRIEKMLLNENGMVILDYPYYNMKYEFIGISQPYLLKQLLGKKIYMKKSYTECIHKCRFLEDHAKHGHDQMRSSTRRLIFSSVLTNFLNYIIHLIRWLLPQFAVVENTTQKITSSYNNYIKRKCCKEFDYYERNFSTIFDTIHIIGQCGCIVEYQIHNVYDSNVIVVEHLTPNCKCASTPSIDVRKGRRVTIHYPCHAKKHHHDFIPSKTCIQIKSPQKTLSECQHQSRAVEYYTRVSTGVIIVTTFFQLLIT